MCSSKGKDDSQIPQLFSTFFLSSRFPISFVCIVCPIFFAIDPILIDSFSKLMMNNKPFNQYNDEIWMLNFIIKNDNWNY